MTAWFLMKAFLNVLITLASIAGADNQLSELSGQTPSYGNMRKPQEVA